jgi:hypothetical protein
MALIEDIYIFVGLGATSEPLLFIFIRIIWLLD